MPYHIEVENGRYCVYKDGESNAMQCYQSMDKANAYLTALNIATSNEIKATYIAPQSVADNARLSSLGLDLIKGHRLGADVQRIGHATNDGCGIFGLIAGQVERLIRHTAGLAFGDSKCLTATDSAANFLGQVLTGFWDHLKPASRCRIWQLVGQGACSRPFSV